MLISIFKFCFKFWAERMLILRETNAIAEKLKRAKSHTSRKKTKKASYLLLFAKYFSKNITVNILIDQIVAIAHGLRCQAMFPWFLLTSEVHSNSSAWICHFSSAAHFPIIVTPICYVVARESTNSARNTYPGTYRRIQRLQSVAVCPG